MADRVTAAPEVRLRVPEELRFFLPVRHRGGDITCPHDGTSSLGHVVESLGIPLTEVGRLAADGRGVPPAHRPRDGELIEIASVPRPQRLPPGAPDLLRFLLDVHLGALARRLRLVGVDTAYGNTDDTALLDRANDERRVLLTRDRGLLRRRALWMAAYVRGDRPDDQFTDVLTRFEPPLAPWTRCLSCNGRLAAVPKSAIAHLLPPGTRRSYDTFTRCRSCERLYWPGAHHARLAVIVDRARTVTARDRPR